MVFRHAPIPRKGSGKQQQQQQHDENLVEQNLGMQDVSGHLVVFILRYK